MSEAAPHAPDYDQAPGVNATRRDSNDMGRDTDRMAPHPPRRLRIAVLNRSFAKTAGGAERYALELVQQLADRHEIHVFAQDIDHEWPGVTYHRVSSPFRKPRWINQLWYSTATWRATRAGQGFDVVHSHENTWHGQVQTVHVLPVWHTLFRGRSGWRWWAKWLGVITSPRLIAYLALEYARFKGPDKRVVVISPSLKQVMDQTFHHLAHPMTLITPGVDVPTPLADHDRQLAKTFARKQLGLPRDGTLLLFVANDFEKKGLQALLDVVCLLSKTEYPTLSLAVVGSLNQRDRFAREAERLGISPRVHFIGPLRDISLAYRAADVLVHPTWEDTFAMVVLEAMAHGLPVVVSGPEYCGIAGLLKDGQEALLLSDPKNVEELADKLRWLLNQHYSSDVSVMRGQVFAQNLSWQRCAITQNALYESIAQEQAQR